MNKTSSLSMDSTANLLQMDHAIWTVFPNQTIVVSTTATLEESTMDSWKLNVYNATYFYLVGVVCVAVSLVGIAGNVLSISVLSEPELRRQPMTTYLIVLSVYDLFVLLVRLVGYNGVLLITGLGAGKIFELKYKSPAVPVTTPMQLIFGTGSVLTTVAMTLDRCFAVVLPLKASLICTSSRVLLVQLLVFFFSVILNVPLFFEFKLHQSHDSEVNVTYLYPAETEYRFSLFHATVFLLALYPVVKMFAPALIIFICNIVIAYTVFRSREAITSSAAILSRTKDAQRITAQVVFISVLTLTSRVLEIATFALLEVNGTIFYDKCSVECFMVAAMNELFLTLNSAANFFCYLYLGTKFRKILLRKLRVCMRLVCCRRESVSESSSRGPAVSVISANRSLSLTSSRSFMVTELESTL